MAEKSLMVEKSLRADKYRKFILQKITFYDFQEMNINNIQPGP